MNISYRPASSPSDWKFVISSWLDASRSSYSSGLVPMESWHSFMWPVYEHITKRPDMRTIVASDRDEQDDLIGFIVADPTEQKVPGKERGQFAYWPALVVFVYVKAPYRKRGFARGLFDAAGIDPHKSFLFASKTPAADRILWKLPRGKFNPLQLRFPKEKKPA